MIAWQIVGGFSCFLDRSADLHGADLSGADLSDANLHGANLSGANLSGADLDFSAWPLCCKSFNVKADDRLVYQLFAHAIRMDYSLCSDEVQSLLREFLASETGCALANGFCKYQSDVEEV